MPVSFVCVNCNKPFKVSSKLAGKKIRCKGCKYVMRIPVPEFDESMMASPVECNTAIQPPAPVTPAAVMATPTQSPDDFVQIESEWIVDCDDCGRQHKPDESLMGKRVKCKCGAILHLTENPNQSIELQPVDPLVGEPLPTDPLAVDPLAVDPLVIEPVPTANSYPHHPNAVYQAPPPSFRNSTPTANSIQSRRRREAEAMVRAADRSEQRRKRRNAGTDDQEMSPMGKVFGGAALLAGGIVWTVVAWMAGYIFPYSFILMAIGVFSMAAGLVESVVK